MSLWDEKLFYAHELWAEGDNMFTKPIKHKALTSMKEVMRWSYRTYSSLSEEKLVAKTVAIQQNRAIVFADEAGCIYITPYRPEIWGILKEAGYTNECTLSVPFSSGGEVPARYKWLQKIAEEENWASTYEKTAQIAQKKGIKPVKVRKSVYYKEITSPYYDTEDNTLYLPMTEMYLDLTDKNVGTYVLVDANTVLVCDEFGRTYLLKNQGVINALVNELISSGYTRTLHPEYYVTKYKRSPSNPYYL